MRIFPDRKIAETGLDQAGFEQLFDAYYDELQHYIYFKSGDQDLSEDIVQDAFVKLWEIRSTVRVETARALLYTISGHMYANRFKRMKLNLKLRQTILEDRTFETPEFEMEVREFDQKLQRVLSEMNENSRVVFLMNRMEQLTYNEIADRLGLSVKAVEKRMTKALEHIRSEIEQKF